ncbi:bifunctional diaminohydroxyphosphoribosylaminopyrimidine deaminase/5-amino-6-(5-phosphoribosylamino)uracil reductase RibD [Sanguibacter hominis ATCC BAA-789]|uniref:Riboflavin biosynthesis protein RibD n=1 Tax=Sanguibacter hominis ATCC BAA-789 TaxID=1312740 RepID=A0A9X5FFV0_9MICO|nr:bifunctional diaminohydroxyphosphoribosylaminopyrimidine deaminase/5-amino-6-(5-phosphoribosylamino)uracil reductase RibD [Sanguibacter hominis]NKX93331.1 bifunctional diaminohydroxyphosphoribosylaminopyrimidine deaminase/5-amino-6-(5-phosphoribosylamino)uracil reductase RibD [Sanguibacter hominis ATCC BAA-789]
MSTLEPGAVTVPSVATLDDAVALALSLATLGPAHGPNPRVGCVLLAPPQAGAPARSPRRVLGAGYHRGAGTAHAEVDAIDDARRRGNDVRGATAVVTLEPCNHTGRTGPCAEALLAADVAEVCHLVPDPNPSAAGGAERLRSAGVHVPGPLEDGAGPGHDLLRVWLHAVTTGRPFVTLKTATSLDGRVAAIDGTSRWITSAESRAHAHRVRRAVDAIAVGTATVLADDPTLTARTPGDGTPGDADHQPVRVVVGRRDVPPRARLRTVPGGQLVHVRTHDVREVLAELARRDVRHLLVEGGPTLAAAFLRAGLVDEVHAYVAPVLLGAGPPALADLGVTTIDEALRLETLGTTALGTDVLVVARPQPVRTTHHQEA